MNVNSVVNQNPRDPLVQYANQVVNQLFYGTLMAEFRSANPPDLMGGGFAGECFTRELDMHLIENLSKRNSSPLAQTLVKKLTTESKPFETALLRQGTNLAGKEVSHG